MCRTFPSGFVPGDYIRYCLPSGQRPHDPDRRFTSFTDWDALKKATRPRATYWQMIHCVLNNSETGFADAKEVMREVWRHFSDRFPKVDELKRPLAETIVKVKAEAQIHTTLSRSKSFQAVEMKGWCLTCYRLTGVEAGQYRPDKRKGDRAVIGEVHVKLPSSSGVNSETDVDQLVEDGVNYGYGEVAAHTPSTLRVEETGYDELLCDSPGQPSRAVSADGLSKQCGKIGVTGSPKRFGPELEAEAEAGEEIVSFPITASQEVAAATLVTLSRDDWNRDH